MSQCIADLNSLRRPDLVLLDAGVILTSNGRSGPGELASPSAVVASVDPVAADAYGTRYLGLEPAAVPMIGKSEKHGVGRADLEAVGVVESRLG